MIRLPVISATSHASDRGTARAGPLAACELEVGGQARDVERCVVRTEVEVREGPAVKVDLDQPVGRAIRIKPVSGAHAPVHHRRFVDRERCA